MALGLKPQTTLTAFIPMTNWGGGARRPWEHAHTDHSCRTIKQQCLQQISRLQHLLMLQVSKNKLSPPIRECVARLRVRHIPRHGEVLRPCIARHIPHELHEDPDVFPALDLVVNKELHRALVTSSEQLHLRTQKIHKRQPRPVLIRSAVTTTTFAFLVRPNQRHKTSGLPRLYNKCITVANYKNDGYTRDPYQ